MGVPGADTASADTASGAAARVVAAARATGPRCGAITVVALDGPSGAGKTILAGQVVAALRVAGARVTMLRMDDLYDGWDGLAAAVPSLQGVFGQLAAGRPGRFRRYDWGAGGFGPTLEVGPSEWIVVDGVGSGARPCRGWLSALVWVDAPEPVRHRRAMDRDGVTYQPHWQRWAIQEQAHFAEHRTAEAATLRVSI